MSGFFRNSARQRLDKPTLGIYSMITDSKMVRLGLREPQTTIDHLRLGLSMFQVGGPFYRGSWPSSSQPPGVSYSADCGEGLCAHCRQLVGGGGIPRPSQTPGLVKAGVPGAGCHTV